MRGYPVGFARALVWTYELTGTYKGVLQGTGTSLSNNTVGAAYVLSDVRTANLAAVAAASIEIEGGDRIVATPSFGGGKTASFELTSSSVDTDLTGLIAGSTVNTANSQHTYFSPNYNRSTPRTLGVAIQQRYETSSGDSYFITRVFPVCTCVISIGQAAYRAGTDTVITVSPINTSKTIDGRSFGSAGMNFGLQDDTADNYNLVSPYAVHFLTYKADGTATTFNTTYKPVSTTITINASTNEMVKNGTVTVLSAVTLAGLVTLAAAGTAADRIFLAYGTEYVPV